LNRHDHWRGNLRYPVQEGGDVVSLNREPVKRGNRDKSPVCTCQHALLEPAELADIAAPREEGVDLLEETLRCVPLYRDPVLENPGNCDPRRIFPGRGGGGGGYGGGGGGGGGGDSRGGGSGGGSIVDQRIDNVHLH